MQTGQEATLQELLSANSILSLKLRLAEAKLTLEKQKVHLHV